MPNAVMKKLIGVGSSTERGALLKLLTKFGCVEVVECDSQYGGDTVDAEAEYDEAVSKIARLEFARRFVADEKVVIKERLKDKSLEKAKRDKKLPLSLQPKPEIDFDRFTRAREWEGDIFARVAELEELNSEIISLKAERAKLENKLEQLKLYRDINAKLSDIVDTTFCSVMLGSINNSKAGLIPQIESAFPNVLIETFGEGETVAIIAICLRTEAEELSAKLAEMEYSACNLSVTDLPRNVIDDIEIRFKEIDHRRAEITEYVYDNFTGDDFKLDIGVLLDFYNVELQKVQAMRNMRDIGSTFLFEAWVLEKGAELIDKKLSDSELSLAYLLRDPVEGESVPTMSVNSGIVTPYQSVTNMFNVPSYNEINPNPFVAFFFILFFGVMISDAGYGLLMALATGILLLIKKPRRHEMSMIKILFAGGISTIFWGILFGGYFGIETALIKEAGIPYLFNPIDDPIYMLALSLGLGMLQMLTGMAINAYALFKQKKPLDAIFGVFSWYVLFIGLAMFALGGKIAGVKYAGIALLALGLVGLMVAGALHKKGVGKLSGAFSNLYSIVNFFSDLLSYTRLFGLGLATGVIALVFNKIAMVMVDINVVIGAIMCPLILIVGHTFNIGINTLGAYVHNSRLQFVEFFGKFYEGAGRLFVPLGSSMTTYNFTLEDSGVLTEIDAQKKAEKRKKSAKAS